MTPLSNKLRSRLATHSATHVTTPFYWYSDTRGTQPGTQRPDRLQNRFCGRPCNLRDTSYGRPFNHPLGVLFLLFVLLFPASCTGRRTAPVLEAPARPESTTQITLDPSCDHDLRGPFTRNDTLFLRDRRYTNLDEGYVDYCRVYVEKGASNNPGDTFTDKWNRLSWKENLALLKKRHPEPFPTHDLKGCPTEWLPITCFQGTFYVDPAFHGAVWLTDSLFVCQSQEGPWPSPLAEVEHSSKNHYRVRTTEAKTNMAQVDIYIIDTTRQIAIFAFGNAETTSFQALYAPIETARHLDRIVWDCSEIPDYNDVSWDQPDYDALVSAAKGLNNTHNEE